MPYVVDTRFDPDNGRRVVELAHDVDLLYAEARFLDVDRDEAEKRHHLTARQSGFLARIAGARRLEVFHFSPRYQGMAQAFHTEAQSEFRGDTRLEETETWIAELAQAARSDERGGAAGVGDAAEAGRALGSLRARYPQYRIMELEGPEHPVVRITPEHVHVWRAS